MTSPLVRNVWNCESKSRCGFRILTRSAAFSLWHPDEWWRLHFNPPPSPPPTKKNKKKNMLTLWKRVPFQKCVGGARLRPLSRWMRGVIDFSGEMKPAPAWRSNCQKCNNRAAEVDFCRLSSSEHLGKRKLEREKHNISEAVFIYSLFLWCKKSFRQIVEPFPSLLMSGLREIPKFLPFLFFLTEDQQSIGWLCKDGFFSLLLMPSVLV